MAKSNQAEKSKATKKAEEQAPNLQQPTAEDIAQPDKNNPDSQAYIRENAKKGESITDPLTRKSMREGQNVELGEEGEE